MTLDKLSEGATAVVQAVEYRDESISRVEEIGVIQGVRLRLARKALLGDPIEIQIFNNRLCIRQSEASRIHVRLLEDATHE